MAFVRRGDTAAFEALYERHSGALLSFCVYMLGSRQDAEDAVQATFASAYRALQADGRPVAVRPWLFTIARNDCLSILRRRHPTVELNGEPALGGDPLRELELHEEVRHTFESLRKLPERQRAALVLAELHGLSQVEIGVVLGVRAEQVKAYVYQARSSLISERRAREADCKDIREELATSRGGALLRGRLRRHVRACADCRVYADGVARQRRQLRALLPLAPSLVLKYRALQDALGIGAADPATYAGGAAVGGSVAGAAAEVAGGGIKALAVKVAAGVAALGATAGVGASMLAPVTSPGREPPTSTTAKPAGLSLTASAGPANAIRWTRANQLLAGRRRPAGGTVEAGKQGSQLSASTQQGLQVVDGSGGNDPGVGNPGDTGAAPQGGNPEPRGKSEGHQGEHEERQGKGGTRSPRGEEARRQKQEKSRQKTEESQRRREDRQRKSEEHKPGGGSRPPKSREERQRQREERKPGGGSRSPKSREERQRVREERKLEGR
ncbi:MAG TPA: sigma-70 family RNA polymerase sigma factor [Solirubrobacteraceae bacterium]|nr:sigma-70 family RNA polymerase sigma factor [Solirubrobacteraceae bacterium]